MTERNKLTMTMPNIVEENVSKIGKLFPNCITQIIDGGKAKVVVDFDMLRQELSQFVVEGAKERYSFTWPDKRKSVLLANAPISKTLRPIVEDSVNFENAKNIYIEGDNLDALKCLREAYLGKVKMIYIDPPYNVGSDYVYKDDFKESITDYLKSSGQIDIDGNRLFANTESNGRFHTDWLNMIYPRLKVARDLLSEDGFIFISIDDREVSNLRKVCDEIFGENLFVIDFLWKKKGTTSNVKGAEASSLVDHTLVYKKSSQAKLKPRIRSKEERTYPYEDEEGRYRLTVIEKKDAGAYNRESMKFEILGHYPRKGKRWQIGLEKAKELERKARFIWDGEKIQLKIYDYEDKDTASAHPNIILLENCGSTESAAEETNAELLGAKEIFSNPKPTELIEFFIKISTDESDLIVDFFSGSGTTGHAVFNVNRELDSSRRFILVQLPEKTEEGSEARKAGFNNICEIGRERLRKALIANDFKSDRGFRAFRIDSTNMSDTFYVPNNVDQSDLFNQIDNIKPDRTAEDLIIQVMLSLGITLDSSIDCFYVSGRRVFDIAEGYLMACFDEYVTEDVVEVIAKKRPVYSVFRDSCFSSDSLADNFKQIFKTYAPDTVCKVI